MTARDGLPYPFGMVQPPADVEGDSAGRLRQLRVFVTVAETGSIGAAAEVLGTTQPPLSRMLMRFERGLGIALFDRHSRGVRLTAAGEALLPSARGVLESLRIFDVTADRVVAGQVGLLRVGTTEGAGALTSTALRLFGAAWPQVQVQLHPAHTPAKLAMLRAGELDVAFVRNPERVRGLETTDVMSEPLVAVVALDHPLARLAEVELAALALYPLMVTPRETNAAVHDAVMAIFERAGVTPTLGPPMRGEGDSLTQIAATCQWTLLSPASAASALPVTALPVVGAGAEVRVSLAWRAHDTRRSVQDFVAAVCDAAGRITG